MEAKLAANFLSQRWCYGRDKFPVPACYAHPLVLKWMQDIVRTGRAQTADEALQTLKEDLQKLNASVTVEQEEYDEIVVIKPLFLVMDYK